MSFLFGRKKKNKSGSESPTPESPSSTSDSGKSGEFNDEERKKIKSSDENERQSPPPLPPKPNPDDESYQLLLEKLKQQDHYDAFNYRKIFKKDEATARKQALNASEWEIQREIDILIGRRSEWSNDSPEALQFRKTMGELYETNKDVKCTEEMKLPKYLDIDPGIPNMKGLELVCGIHFVKCIQFPTIFFHALPCDVKLTDSEFQKIVIDMANRYRVKDTPELKSEEWVLKIAGRNEYIYGGIQLYKFDAIRKVLKYGKVYMEMILCNKQQEIEKLGYGEERIDFSYFFSHSEKKRGSSSSTKKKNKSIKSPPPIPGRRKGSKYKKNNRKEKIMYGVNTNRLEYVKSLSITDLKTPFRIFLDDLIFLDEPLCNDMRYIKENKINCDSYCIYVQMKLVYGFYTLGESYSTPIPLRDLKISSNNNNNNNDNNNNGSTHCIKFDGEEVYFPCEHKEKGNDFRHLKWCEIAKESVLQITIYLRFIRRDSVLRTSSFSSNNNNNNSSSSNNSSNTPNTSEQQQQQQQTPTSNFVTYSSRNSSLKRREEEIEKNKNKKSQSMNKTTSSFFSLKNRSKSLPKENLYRMKKNVHKDVPLGFYNLSMMSFDGVLRSGSLNLPLHSFQKSNPWTFCDGFNVFANSNNNTTTTNEKSENNNNSSSSSSKTKKVEYNSRNRILLNIRLDEFALPVRFPTTQEVLNSFISSERNSRSTAKKQKHLEQLQGVKKQQQQQQQEEVEGEIEQEEELKEELEEEEEEEEERNEFKEWEKENSFKFSIIKGAFLNLEINKLLKMTPLDELTPKQCWILWKARDKLIQYPDLLPHFLSSVPYHIPQALAISEQYIERWRHGATLSALELLDYKFSNCKARAIAVERIDLGLPDQELSHYLLQLVQALKFESFHDSPLARFLLKRGLRNEFIGQFLFWYLKSEMNQSDSTVKERFGLILEEFLKRCGGFRVALLRQTCIVEQLYQVSLHVKTQSSKRGVGMADLAQTMREGLKAIQLPPGRFKLPLTPRVELCGLLLSKCKVMSSAKKPLLLNFKNADPHAPPYGILFKVGDDLRQDLLTLQMLRIMDHLWKSRGIDNHIRAYDCVTTGELQGMIEIVPSSSTMADIMVYRGFQKQFSKDIIWQWIKSKNKPEKNLQSLQEEEEKEEEEKKNKNNKSSPSKKGSKKKKIKNKKKDNNKKDGYERVRRNFLQSSAGYCVASYSLGLGDRHADNIMCGFNGDLFHIDFGHFLGHKKKFLGMERETTPFVFTYQYCHVLGGKKSSLFSEFVKRCVDSFNILRKKTKLLMVLLILMLGTGIPELKSKKDIEWIKNSMRLELTDEKAEQFVLELINLSLSDKRQNISDGVHNAVHKLFK